MASLACGAGFNARDQLHLVLAAPGQLSYWQLRPSGQAQLHAIPSDAQVPLGSLWKLWVYAYLADSQDTSLTEQPYSCQGNNPEEAYCCSNKGETIGRDQAPARSCGLYFNPARLNIDAARWRTYWQSRALPQPARAQSARPRAQRLAYRAHQFPSPNCPPKAKPKGAPGGDAQHQGRPYAEQLGSRLRVKPGAGGTPPATPLAALPVGSPMAQWCGLRLKAPALRCLTSTPRPLTKWCSTQPPAAITAACRLICLPPTPSAKSKPCRAKSPKPARSRGNLR